MGRELEKHGVLWFEEPVIPEDRLGYRKVRDALAIPIAGGTRRVVLSTVALDTEHEPPGLLPIRDGEIDPKARRPNLCANIVASGAKPIGYLRLELAGVVETGFLAQAKLACLGEGEEHLQSHHPTRAAALGVNVRSGDERLPLAWAVALGAFSVVMFGGVLGLAYVPDDQWGGLPVTLILATLGLVDVALTAVIGSSDAPPLIVSLGVAALGLITLLALAPARRGSRGALTAIVVTRVISAVLAVPAFFLNAPAWVVAVEGFVIATTITALVVVYRQNRRPA